MGARAMSSRPGCECSWDRPAAPSEDGARPPSSEMFRPGGIDDDREGYGFRKKLAGYRRQPAQVGSYSLRWSSHHGHHAGRAPGKAAVGLQRTVRRRPLARQYVAGRERCTAQHVFGLRPRGLVGWSAWRPVLCPPGVLHLACAHDGLCGPGRHPRSEEHTSELQSQSNLVCRLLLEKKKNTQYRRCWTEGNIGCCTSCCT